MQTAAPQESKRTVATWTPDEAGAFLRAIRGDRLEALYVLALMTGARQGELLALHWRDVDLGRATLSIRGTLQRVDGRLVVLPPKTEHSRLLIALPALAVDALTQHRARGTGSGFVFLSARGRAMDGSVLRREFKDLLARAGLPRIRFHDLRHCCASLLLAQNVHPKVVQELLGVVTHDATL